MRDDKIIRAVSDINDQYILEADPEEAGRRNRAAGHRTGRIIGIAAAVVLTVSAGVFGGTYLISSGSAKSTANYAAAEVQETAAGMNAVTYEEMAEAGIDEKAVAAAEPADGAIEEAAEEAEIVPDGEEASVFELAYSPEGTPVLLVRVSAAEIRVEGTGADICFLNSDGTNSLYLVTPKEEAAAASYCTVTFTDNVNDTETSFAVGPEDLSPEMSEEMQALYDTAQGPVCGISDAE